MTSNIKCIYKYRNNDDGDPEFLISPCFSISSNVQLKEIPTTGEEYLLKVMKERENIAVITRCTKDYSKNSKMMLIEELPCAKLAPEKLKPTMEWQNIQVADFSEVRMYILRLRTKNSQAIKVVEIDDNNLSGWKKFFNDMEPTLSCVIGMRQSVLDNGIEFLTEIIGEIHTGETVDHKTGQWIYAFLACTRQPLLSDSISILRNLARKCAEIRSHINPEAENALEAVAPLNVFICLVARYFGQYDLAD